MSKQDQTKTPAVGATPDDRGFAKHSNNPAGGKASITDVSQKRAAELDQFYTPDDTATVCVEHVMRFWPANEPVQFVEPSAGHGVFMRAVAQFGSVVGYDIDPKVDDIIKADFLKLDPDKVLPPGWDGKATIGIGNPPFGKNAATAIQFVNHLAKAVDTVAFILPRSFRRYNLQKKVDPSLMLIADFDIDDHFIFCGKRKKVGVCLQIWSRRKLGPDLRLTSKLPQTHPDFEMAHSNRAERTGRLVEREWDFSVPVSGNGKYEITTPEVGAENRPTSVMFFRAEDDKVLSRLKMINFKCLAERYRVTVASYCLGDVVAEYEAIKSSAANDNTSLSDDDGPPDTPGGPAFVCQDLRIRAKPRQSHPDFILKQYNAQGDDREHVFSALLAEAWDYAIRRQGFGSYKLVDLVDVPNDASQHWLFIRVNHPNAHARLREIDFNAVSCRKAVSTPGLSYEDVVEAYEAIVAANDRIIGGFSNLHDGAAA